MSARGATLTIRDVPARVVKSLKRLASRQNKSMEQQVRDILEQHVAERDSVLKQIEASWARQSRRPESNEIDAWITGGREGGRMAIPTPLHTIFSVPPGLRRRRKTPGAAWSIRSRRLCGRRSS